MNMRKLGLRSKIGVGFGSLLAIISTMGLVGYRSAEIGQKASQEAEMASTMKDIAGSMQQSILVYRIGARDVLMGRDKDATHLFEKGEQDFTLQTRI